MILIPALNWNIFYQQKWPNETAHYTTPWHWQTQKRGQGRIKLVDTHLITQSQQQGQPSWEGKAAQTASQAASLLRSAARVTIGTDQSYQYITGHWQLSADHALYSSSADHAHRPQSPLPDWAGQSAATVPDTRHPQQEQRARAVLVTASHWMTVSLTRAAGYPLVSVTDIHLSVAFKHKSTIQAVWRHQNI